MAERKGIILAGGTGSRLWPITQGVSKQLLPVHDKPMIYYPLTVLMLARINDVVIITTEADQTQFTRLLGDGSQWGMNLSYITQASPDGLAQAYLLSESYLAGNPSTLILGDNIFFGHGLPEMLESADQNIDGGTVFGYQVSDPERYGVVDFDEAGSAKSIVEKPTNPSSKFAITGLYFLDGTASDRAKEIRPSGRGELEITSLLEQYLIEDNLRVERLGRGFAWLDTGTHESLLAAGNFVNTLQKRQGLQVGSPDEVAFRNHWISEAMLEERAHKYGKSEYGILLKRLLEFGR